MYLDFFGLEREPFHITPDPDFLFPSPSHKEAFATVMYGVQQQKGFVVVTGEVGTGKTTVLRAYLQKLKDTDIQPIYVFDPHLEFEELLEAILAELGAPSDAGHTQFSRLQWLRHYLIDAYSNGRSVVLIIDEAQNMPVETMEKLRVLTNLETTKDKLLQVLLVGQPELEEKLGLHQLRQLNQRVAVRATLRPLGDEESTDYIKHRVRQAGGVPETIFTPASLKAIVRHAKGNPRVLNITCDNVLAAALGAQQSPITPALVREVLRDLSPKHARSYDIRRMAPLAAAAAAILVVGIGAGTWLRGTPGVEAAAPAPASPGLQESLAKDDALEPEVEAADANEEKKPLLDTRQIALNRMLERERSQAAVTEESTPVAEPEPAVESPAEEATTAPVAEEPVALEQAVEAAPAPEPAAEPISASLPETTADSSEVEVTPEEVPAPKADAPAIAEEPEPAEPSTTETVEAPVVLAAAPVESAPVEAAAAAPQVETNAPPESEAATEAPPVEPAPLAKIPAPVETAPREQEPLSPAPLIRDENGRLVRQVKKGDKLILLLEEVYGKSNDALIQSVRDANPGMIDPNLILAGEELVFPNVDQQTKTPAGGEANPPAGN
ncbi:MAG: hypothetical protein RLZZ303_1537 [Candidatus Hydrogenedentota bacterium]